MRRIAIYATCTATVEERWTFDVEDDELAAEALESVSVALRLINEVVDAVTFVDVVNTAVYDEHDREVDVARCVQTRA